MYTHIYKNMYIYICIYTYMYIPEAEPPAHEGRVAAFAPDCTYIYCLIPTNTFTDARMNIYVYTYT